MNDEFYFQYKENFKLKRIEINKYRINKSGSCLIGQWSFKVLE